MFFVCFPFVGFLLAKLFRWAIEWVVSHSIQVLLLFMPTLSVSKMLGSFHHEWKSEFRLASPVHNILHLRYLEVHPTEIPLDILSFPMEWQRMYKRSWDGRSGAWKNAICSLQGCWENIVMTQTMARSCKALPPGSMRLHQFLGMLNLRKLPSNI